MRGELLIFLFILHNVGFARSGYPTMGDEVQPGSVLLPASRRGRYLANIVRRQAVDGTGIKFNKDADRMNAEAKKKVDVLSEELLPYIIAEQERRTSLYKRVMTAVQNGENGVTIAEIRNKPPAIIRKGLMYRCPTNRAPLEPDGSGAIRCEDNIDPTPIMFESCLSAEDRELYVADNKYFFCNRHRVEGADLPRNGSAVIGCAPAERTTLNYTSQKCALEDTDDVVVHYRYYPDKTYKFVSELDPDREVCDHWTPCQVSYIFSLPGPDQAAPAIELWHDYDDTDQVSEDEIVPAIPEDDINETFIPGEKYKTSKRTARVPDGFRFHGVGMYLPDGQRVRLSTVYGVEPQFDNLKVAHKLIGNAVQIALAFDPIMPTDAATYYARFESTQEKNTFVHVPIVILHMGRRRLVPLEMVVLPGQRVNATRVGFTCDKCALRRVMLRVADGTVRNVDEHKYSTRRVLDDQGEEQSVIDLDMKVVNPRDFGDYFLMVQNEDGDEESIKALTIRAHEDSSVSADISVTPLIASGTAHEQFRQSMEYSCPTGQLVDVLCHGVSVLDPGRISVKPTSVEFHFASFEDVDACVYMGVFKVDEQSYKKELAVIDNIQIESDPPEEPVDGEPFSHVLRYSCRDNCTLTQVNVNGIPLEATARRASVGSVGYYLLLEKNEVKISITEYSPLYAGYYQGVFKMKKEHITKELMKIGIPAAPASGRRGGAELSELEADSGAEGEQEQEQEQKHSHMASKSSMGHKSESENRVEPAAVHQDATYNSIKVHPLRDAAQAKHPYDQKTIRYECPPGGHLVAVRCRGRDVTTGLDISDANKVKIGFDPFQDTDACVYVGVFKVGETEYNKTLAVLENNLITATSASVAPPASGELKHEVTYTCNVAKSCKPIEIYINDKVLKSNDVHSGFTVTSKEKTLPNGKEVTTVTLHLSIKPFTSEYEGVYQLVVSHGKERITKNIMEVA